MGIHWVDGLVFILLCVLAALTLWAMSSWKTKADLRLDLINCKTERDAARLEVAALQEFEQWYTYGLEQGFVFSPCCYVHDTPLLTAEEEQQVEAEGDLDAICIPIVRVQQ